MMAITLQKAFELMFYLLLQCLLAREFSYQCWLGIYSSGIPDGQGIFLKKAICEGHRAQA